MIQEIKITANYIDIQNKETYPVEIIIKDKKVFSITKIAEWQQQYILPGFIDAHVHIESSMLMPSEFARIAVQHGTVGTISDPHEIANVLGVAGVELMIDNAAKINFHCCFGAPSCVPATIFETSGATLSSKDIDYLMQKKEIYYLSEVMNYPGVLNGDKELLEKIAITKKYNKPVDGHAPGLTGDEAIAYIQAGISTDHECTTYDEALHKLKNGMKILIREGSAAKNFDALIPLMNEYAQHIMLCSDDKHPDNLITGHINLLVKRAIALGYNMYDVLQAACINPVLHYKMPVGLLNINDSADFILIDNPENFNILQTYINGVCVYGYGANPIPSITTEPINNFNIDAIQKEQLVFNSTKNTIAVIEALNGQLITNKIEYTRKSITINFESDIEHDILKLVCINRYNNAAPSIAFIKNFGLKRGAIASSVAHDSHNIVAVGTSDFDLCNAINALIASKGGISVSQENTCNVLPLPIAGIISNKSAEWVAQQYSYLDAQAKALGSLLDAPFMTLSFMALPVIPTLKITDKGLFDVGIFNFVEC